MTNLLEALQLAVGHHSAGRLNDAADLYQQILAADPCHADATHLLGVVAHQSGDPPTAVTLIKAAIQLDGERAFYHNNLGQAQQSLGRPDAAAASFQRAIELDSRCCQAFYNLAMLRHDEGDWVSTVALCRRATAIKPDYTDALRLLAVALWAQEDRTGALACYEQFLANEPGDLATIENLGVLHRDLGDYASAAERFHQALAIDPRSAQWHVHLGDLAALQHDWQAAIGQFETAIAVDPQSAKAHMHLGSAWQAQGELERAIVHYRRAIDIQPDRADALYNLGTAEQKLRRLDEAAEHFRAALAADPRLADASLHLGDYHQQRGDLDLALHYYDRALEVKQVSAKAHFNRGMILLSKGRWNEGWQEYEWRTKILESPTRRFDHLPRWDGGQRPSATLLVHWEQGLGDSLQFIRYVPLIRNRVGRVITLVARPLARILRHAGFVDVYDDEHALPEIDCQIPLLSLPGIVGTTLANVPAAVPYLTADETLVEKWRERLSSITGLRIGICWQGNARNLIDKTRSLPLASFEPVAQLPGVQLISLQKRDGLEQVDQVRERFAVHKLGGDWDESAGPFMDSAAVMQNLDLVITADTAVAHLAGALGVRVWVLLSIQPDWRWLHERGDTPWYPTMRLMRQSRTGDWDELLTRVAAEVAGLQTNR